MQQNPESDAAQEGLRERERIAGEELQAAVLKMRYDACCDRLNSLSKRSAPSSEELAEIKDLHQNLADMKRRLGL